MYTADSFHTQAGDKIFLAGIVPLVPSTLNVVDGGISAQCSVAIMHIEKILKAMLASCTLKQCPLVVCYVTSQDYISTALQEWNKAVEVIGTLCLIFTAVIKRLSFPLRLLVN